MRWPVVVILGRLASCERVGCVYHYIVSCLAVFQTNAIGNACSKLFVPIHQIPHMFLMGKLIG